MKYRLLSVPDTELTEAARWYETQATGLGQEFLEESQRCKPRSRLRYLADGFSESIEHSSAPVL
jgi:hypothetical protein